MIKVFIFTIMVTLPNGNRITDVKKVDACPTNEYGQAQLMKWKKAGYIMGWHWTCKPTLIEVMPGRNT